MRVANKKIANHRASEEIDSPRGEEEPFWTGIVSYVAPFHRESVCAEAYRLYIIERQRWKKW